MLQLKSIRKEYPTPTTTVVALHDISINFRKSEFVSILGQSGCGKTTMLNIIGGLDRYTAGDLVINGKSTKTFQDGNWDTYRNHSVGFVFQSYNLISHLSLVGNVELALTLSGVSVKERRKRAIEALTEVGLADHVNKRPNQLSGGQMQRVAIARALVNNPEIILADEPTGALDSKTSVQVMDILKKIAKKRLIIMVTHNPELAYEYSNRIIKMKDGDIVEDNNAFSDEDFDKMILAEQQKVAKAEKAKLKEQQDYANENKGKKLKSKKQKENSSMGWFTALSLSGKNLFSKKAKTLMTAFAGSIGIIGIALVLAISNGFSAYITQMQTDILGGYPITMTTASIDMMGMFSSVGGSADTNVPDDFNDNGFITPDTSTGESDMFANMFIHNVFTAGFVDYIQSYASNSNNQQYFNELAFSYGNGLNIVSSFDGGEAQQVSGFYQGLNNNEYVKSQYDILAGTYPAAYNEVALVIPSNNYIDQSTLEGLGLSVEIVDGVASNIDFQSVLNDTNYQVVLNDTYYAYNNNSDEFNSNEAVDMFDKANNINLTVTAVIRVKQETNISVLSAGIMYLPELTNYVMEQEATSEIVTKQKEAQDKIYIPYDFSTIDFETGSVPSSTIVNVSSMAQLKELFAFWYGSTLSDELVMEYALQGINGSTVPTSLTLYPTDFSGKEQVLSYIDAWNETEEGKIYPIKYSDTTAMFTATMTTMVDVISYVLIAFASVSLFVSSIMIGILTYASVLERTKEIGVLRSIGARKKDVSRIFNAETFIIGVGAGVLGVLVTYTLCPIINIIVKTVAGSVFNANIAIFNPIHAVVLISISASLTIVAGLIPSRVASKKDPVKALRSE